MDDLEFKFGVEEAPDGKSFIFYDITGVYDMDINPGGWPEDGSIVVNTAYIQMREHSTNKVSIFQLPTDIILWEQGIEYNITDGNGDITGEKFIDGAYEFTVFINSQKVANRSFGFYAQIKEDVMKESLSYRPERERVYRELIWEKLRLLDNLFYATETDQIKHFVENLSQLKKLK